MENKTEVWLRGPIAEVPALLQPVAHALLQSNDEIHTILNDFPDSKLWEQPSGVASVAFHLQHIAGVLDRLFTYAKGEQLNNIQLKYLSEEGLENDNINTSYLLTSLHEAINRAIVSLKSVDDRTLTHKRTVGRKQLPSTVLGLFFHAAEHTMRHTGQLLVTVRILTAE